jgi:hypothetical protein
MELHESFRLPAVLRAEPSATQHEHHRMLPRMLPLQSPCKGQVRRFAVWSESS